MKTRAAIVVILTTIGLVACAADQKPAQSPQAGSRSEASPAQEPGYPTAAAPSTAPPPPPRAPAEAPSPAQPQKSAADSSGASRGVAMSQASNEIESSQRELDVASGDCHNACRALGSMDRAAGRICGLAQSTDELRRCGEAKTHVYSARDKVKNTCGTCPDVSVDRDAPIPSR